MEKSTDHYQVHAGYSGRIVSFRSRGVVSRKGQYFPTKLEAIRKYGWYARSASSWDYTHPLEYVQGIGLL